MFLKSLITLFALLLGTSSILAGDSKEEVKKWVTEDLKFPFFDAFDRMTPKMIRVVMGNYLNLLAPETFETLTPTDVEVIWTAVSAANNCELCLSFHGMSLGQAGKDDDDVKAIIAGGIPKDTVDAALVIGAKYSLAHKGPLLPREKAHLETLGFTSAKLIELTYVVGQMAALNHMYIYLINEGIDVEDFLKVAGPFAGSVYKDVKVEL